MNAECVPGIMCFHCPYPDCIRYASPPTTIEKAWYAASNNNHVAVTTKTRLEGGQRYTQKEQAEKHREQSRDWGRAIRQERKAKGLCSQCGKNKVKPGRVTCPECIKKNKARREKLKEERIAKGLCTKCGKKKAAPGDTECKACRAKEKVVNRRNWEKRKAAQKARLSR